MVKDKPIPIIVKDTPDMRHIFIQIDLKKRTTSVMSGFSAWDNLAYLMEALALTAQKCINEGISQRKVFQTIKDYLVKVLPSYYNVTDDPIKWN